MNTRQRMALKWGIALIILTALLAPWSIVSHENGMLLSHCYGLIIGGPEEMVLRQYSGVARRLDTAQLYAEWAFVVLVIGGFVLLNADRPE